MLRYAGYAGLEATLAREEGAAAVIEIRAAPATGPLKGALAAPSTTAPPAVSAESAAGATVFLSSSSIGRGDDELGALLMRGFTYALAEAEVPPARVILMNSGVRLAIEGSECLPNLRTLAESGIDVLACGTCLEYYGLKDKLAVGRVSNMYEIAGLLLSGRSLSL